eukprot:TRINITY_DN9594_c0_g1_i1.p1 TRINITY_DN9594_c0_g1~~TRINITY_DN9594_c0_g1_i1.p1  ORF type:complete len:666 (-),score=113.86 TRINITY_DN9594_c0_g1_i1:504-2501(-)
MAYYTCCATLRGSSPSLAYGREGCGFSQCQTMSAKVLRNCPSIRFSELGAKSLEKVRKCDSGCRFLVCRCSGNTTGEGQRSLKILVAGGGIGGLVFALAARKKGFQVKVFERDISAIKGEGQYRGPIQIQSNALAALEAIDQTIAEEIMASGCVTGDRINGLVDGISGAWFIKFDTFTPAVEKGLPVTRVINRMTLQEILARAVGSDTIENSSNVVDFEDDGSKVKVILEDGRCYEGDLLIGADGIRSKVRQKLFGPSEATYSGYTCYSGIADYVPADIDVVGYQVFLGHKQYFVSSDVGHGKVQWYAFYKEPAGGTDSLHARKKRLLELFGHWCDKVVDVLMATPEEMILRRDIYDRTPIMTWSKGLVTLLGDSVHAMQPNMGQGGCMAIEDSYQLALELDKAFKKGLQSGKPIEVMSAFKRYEKERRVRVAVIYAMARMAALMASTYKPYLGVGLGPLSFLTKLRIPHPGRVGGRYVISKAMPLMLEWVLGGNSTKLEGRVPSCRLSEKANDELRRWFEDDDALERAINAQWCLEPADKKHYGSSQVIYLSKDEHNPCIVGSNTHSDLKGISIAIQSPQVSDKHARITYKDNAFFITDLQSQHGTWIKDVEGRKYRVPSGYPVRIHPGYVIEFGPHKEAVYRVRLHKVQVQSTETKRQTVQQS